MAHPIVELDELVSADAVGLDALVRIEQHGAELAGLLEYLRFELDALKRSSARDASHGQKEKDESMESDQKDNACRRCCRVEPACEKPAPPPPPPPEVTSRR